MNPKSLVRLSNIIATVSILVLLYWVFTFVSSSLFGFSILGTKSTETFAAVTLSILALMAGALIINIMFNLTRIAEKHNQDTTVQPVKRKRRGFLLLVVFPVIVLLLWGGDYFTDQKAKDFLMESAKRSIEPNTGIQLAPAFNYDFDQAWMESTSEALRLWNKAEKDFPYTQVIVKDTIGASSVFLSFGIIYEESACEDDVKPEKENYIMETSPQDKEYLNSVFEKGIREPKFSDSKNHTLYYPVFRNGKTIVLRFSENQTYRSDNY